MPDISITLSEKVFNNVEKRAKKNMLSVKEQIEDIVRRSMVCYNKTGTTEDTKIDDALINVFSRKNVGRKRKGENKKDKSPYYSSVNNV
jgi:hypothetical protein